MKRHPEGTMNKIAIIVISLILAIAVGLGGCVTVSPPTAPAESAPTPTPTDEPAPTPTPTPTPTSPVPPQPSDEPKPQLESPNKTSAFGGWNTKEGVSAALYPSLIKEDYVHQLTFSFFNGSSETIWAFKVKIFNGEGDDVYTLLDNDMPETWDLGRVKSGKSLSMSVDFIVPATTNEIHDWHLVWYCLDADGVHFNVKTKCSSK